MDATVAQLGLPQWLLAIMFLIGGLATVFQILKTVVPWFARPTLEARLTKEIFFRLVDDGECAFLNAIYLVRNGAVEVRRMALRLTRLGESPRSYPLEVLRLGEKRLGQGPLADFVFYTESPLFFLTPNLSSRPVILAGFSEHLAVVRETIRQFQARALDLRDKLRESATSAVSDAEKRSLYDEAAANLEALTQEFTAMLSDATQLEPGEFNLRLEVTYRPSQGLLRRRRVAASALHLVVDEDFRASFRRALHDMLFVRGRNVLLEKNDPVAFPSYEPFRVRELESIQKRP